MISKEQLERRVAELARRIDMDYQDKELVVVGVLKGAFIFMSDLIRQLDLPLTCDFLRVSSYRESTHSNGVRIEFDLTQPIRGKHVLLVEDIIDTGLTARCVYEGLMTKRPLSLRICALLKKGKAKRSKIRIDYLGFTIPNRFVVGYGLDLAGRYRNLPFIGVID